MRCLLTVLVAASALMAAPGASEDNPDGAAVIVPGVEQPAEQRDKVQWGSLLRDSLLFSSIQHAFRLATEPGTREGMKGPFWGGYLNSVKSLHGWSDGDPFYVNYVGHPMMGAASALIWTNNDPRYYGVTFGRNPDYWRSRLRAMGFAWAYSTLFEIGPYSEATVGKIQETAPQQGFVDHVVTPTIGIGWTIGEDAIDKYLILPLENRISNRYVKLFLRGGLNPARSFANAMSWKVPWHRQDRGGVGFDRRPYENFYRPREPRQGGTTQPTGRQVAPFEFHVYPSYARLSGSSLGKLGCAGGGAEALFNLTRSFSLTSDFSGCKLLGMPEGLSGNDFLFLGGPRFTYRNQTRWNAYTQLLLGGRRLTMLYDAPPAPKPPPDVKPPVRGPLFQPSYQDFGFTMAGRAGVEVVLNRAASLRLANLEYSRSWMAANSAASIERGLRFSVGFQLRTGTW